MSLEREVRSRLRAAVAESGITQIELAERTGYTLKHVNRVLTGKCGLSFAALESIAVVLGLDIVLVKRGGGGS